MNGRTQLAGTKAVVFDVFGTLVKIENKRRPYRQLIQIMEDAGRTMHPDDGAKIMSTNVGLSGVAEMFGVDIPNSIMAKLELDLYAELISIKSYPEVDSTLDTLRRAGLKIGLCSNLAAPYAIPVKLLLPFELDAYTWSFEAGAIKPSFEIYEKLCTSLDCEPHQVLMIGDTLEEDHTAPRRFGMQAFHLARAGLFKVSESLKTLDEIFPLLDIR